MKKSKTKIILFILFFGAIFLFSNEAQAADYVRYVDVDAAAGGNGSTMATSGANCAFKTLSQVNAFISSTMSVSDTAKIYFQRGDTWHLTSNTGIAIKKSHITLDAYGSETLERPIISGNYLWPNDKNLTVINVGGNAQEDPVNYVYIKNLQILNVHDGINWEHEGGGGIIFNGMRYTDKQVPTPNYADGPGGIENCKIDMMGKSGITLYGMWNDGGEAIVIDGCEISRCSMWLYAYNYHFDPTGEDRALSYPQSVNTNLSKYGLSYGHEIRNCWVHDTQLEGIGASAFYVVENNVIGNTMGPAIYSSDGLTDSTTGGVLYKGHPPHTRIIRNNIIYYDSDSPAPFNDWRHKAHGIRTDDEGTGFSNSHIKHAIYGNAIFGRDAGIALRNSMAPHSPWGEMLVFNNTLIGNKDNIIVGNPALFDSAKIFNNTSVIYDDDSELCRHFNAYVGDGYAMDWSTWTWGPNHFYGDSLAATSPWYAPTGTLPDITGSPNFSKTSGWRSLKSQPAKAQYTPGESSALINAGGFPAAYTGKSGNTLTGVAFANIFFPGDILYDDEKRQGTVVSVTANTITLINAASFDASGSLFPALWSGSTPDMGAVEYVGNASAPSAPAGLSVR